MARNFPRNRQGIPSGSVVGRLNGTGTAQVIPITQVIQQAIASGTLTVPAGVALLAAIADSRILANISGANAAPIANTLTAILDHIMGSTEGQILQRGASAWQVLAPGTANQVLASGGAAALNAWSGLSALLDTVFGNTEGNILQRGASAWQVLAPGTAGQFLKSGGSGALNSWAAANGSFNNTGAWSGLSGYNPFDVATYEGAAYCDYVAIAAPTGAAQQWDSGDNVGMTLSTTNTTNDTAVSTATANANVEGTVSQTAGKWYFEGLPSNLLDNGTTLGIAQAALAQNFGGNALGTVSGSYTGHGTGSFAGLTNNKRAGVAVDLTNKLFWITADVTAVPISWNGSTSNNPGTGVGGITIGTGSLGTVFPSWYTPTSANQKCILFTTAAAFSIPAIPNGFSAWSVAAVPNLPPDEDKAHWIGQGNTYPPGGRLSLTSNVAVQTVDVVGGTTIYYVPYIHRGLGHLGLDLAAQISLALDSNSGHTGYHQSGKNFDIFVEVSTGTPRLVTGPAWTSDTARSAAIDQTTVPGLWSNTATMTTKFDTTASTYSAPAGTLLYIGSFRASANGQCTVQFNPAASAGGSNTLMYLYNAYNKVRAACHSADNTFSWTYGTATWRTLNNSVSNRVSFIDGLGQDRALAGSFITATCSSSGYNIGFVLDSTTATPAFNCQVGVSLQATGFIYDEVMPGIGFHYIQAMEFSGGAPNSTIFGLVSGNQYNEFYVNLAV